jgi:structural maintenance of chromosomes protein 6
MESPFRLMDEYDVFLDELTRKITLTSLQHYALSPEQNNRQFIIITPQNLSDIKTSNEVRIRSLGAPVRTSAHGLQQQTLEFN